jgi:hypothetical protein
MNARIIDLPKIEDLRGNLSVIESSAQIPFKMKRTYLIYDVPGGQVRGGHSYRNQEEFIISLSGSFDIHLDDGTEKEVFSMNRSYYGLFVPNMIWRSMKNFSTNALCLVLSSTLFDEKDYIRDYELFLKEGESFDEG